MRIAHMADPLIGVIADFYLPEMQDKQWQKERIEAFGRACDSAIEEKAELILLTGKLFAEGYLPDSVISQVLDLMREKKILFVWRCDDIGREYLKHKTNLPDNLFLLGGIMGQEEFIFRDAHIFCFSEEKKLDGNHNLLLWEETGSIDQERLNKIQFAFPKLQYIIAREANYYLEQGRFLAEPRIKLEHSGFDDGEISGYVLLDLKEEKGKTLPRRTVEMAQYHFHRRLISLEGEETEDEVYRRCIAATSGLGKHDFVRIVLQGEIDVESFVDAALLTEKLRPRFFYLEVFNDCKMVLDEAVYANEISLKSEFIRMVLGEDSLSESEKSRIIQCGWNALRGKELSE